MWSEVLRNLRPSSNYGDLVSVNSYRLLWILILLWFYLTLNGTSGDQISEISDTSDSWEDFNVKFARINADSSVAHSRRKRFLGFPVGSSFSCAVCLTTGVLGNPNYQFLSTGVNWGLAYNLPNSTWILEHIHHGTFKASPSGGGEIVNETVTAAEAEKDIKAADAEAEKNINTLHLPVLRRRQRRDLYDKLERIIDSMGYNGRDCVLRALCESRQYFRRDKLTMIGEMLRVVFSLPNQRLFTRELHENSEIEVYDRAYRQTREIDCADQYECDFSLLELAFGKYSTPPEGYYQ